MSNYRLRIGATPSPAWLASVPNNTWVEIPNSNVSAYTTPGGFNVSFYILNAYSGCFVDEDDSIIVMHGGGHNDYSGNEVIGLRLNQSSPELFTICEPTPLVDRVPLDVWWGTVPNQKPNTAHTFDYGIYCSSSVGTSDPAQGRYIWLGQSSPYNSSGGVTGGDRMFSLVKSTGQWVQLASDLGQLPTGVGRACTKDSSGNIYLAAADSVSKIFKYTLGSGWSTFSNNAILAGSSYYSLIYDSTRNKLLRIGNSLVSGYWISIDCSTGTPTDVSSFLSGTGSIVSDLNTIVVKDSPGACYDPINDRYLVVAGSGGNVYAINPTTWVVTLLSLSTVSGTIPQVSGAPTLGAWGRFKYVPALKGVFYAPDGNYNAWFLKLA